MTLSQTSNIDLYDLMLHYKLTSFDIVFEWSTK